MHAYLQRTDDGLPMRPSGTWASEKLDYLRRYVDVFEKSMRAKWTYRNYVDLQAGPGKNRVDQTGQILLGSPLLALTTEVPFTGYYFVEYDPAYADALRTRCSASDLFKRVHLTAGDCNQVVRQIVDQLKIQDWQSLNLAFLDPEGLELQWSTVAILASVRRMDLIINYPQGGLNRFMPIAIEQEGETPVDMYFGTYEWRAIYRNWQISRLPGLHRQLIDLYKSNLQTLGYVDIKRDNEVGDEPLIRNSRRKAPLYRLLFASKNQIGEKFWREVTKRNVYGQRSLFD